MNTQAQLCHIDASRCVVLVTAYEGSVVLGSALGEGETSETAEDRALQRLKQRLDPTRPSQQPSAVRSATTTEAVTRDARTEPIQRRQPETSSEAPSPQSTADPERSTDQGPPQVAQPAGELTEPPTPVERPEHSIPSEAPTDPEDWSDELAAIELEVRRIGWTREDERSYLERAFGLGSRHRLTRYSDLVAYLKRLKALEPGTPVQAAPVPLRRTDLIAQGDEMLKTLNWSSQQARQFLQSQLSAQSRQALSDEQLLAFNMLLENQLVEATTS